MPCHPALLAAALLLAPAAAGAPPRWTDALERGAVPDGRTLNTALLNRLVQDLSAAGGGTLRLPPGTYLTGTVFLKDHVTLHLDAGAVLLGSTDLADYPETAPPRPSRVLEYGRYALVQAVGAQDVAIEGPGTIDGQGDHPQFTKKALEARGWPEEDAYLKRPFGLSFIRCRGVRVQDATLRNLAFWCEGYLDCEDVVVEHVTVDSRKLDANNDGIDLDGCRRARVAHCRFNAGDDAICLKSSYQECRDVVITDCACSSLANGIKLGTASGGGFRNIEVSHCVLKDVQAAGLALESVDGGTLEDVRVSDLAMDGVGSVLFIRLGDLRRRWVTDAPRPGLGRLGGVTIDGLDATLRHPPDGEGPPALPCSITGLPGRAVERIALSHVRIRGWPPPGPGAADPPLGAIPEAPKVYPENGMFGPLPAYGFYVRHARDLAFRNVELLQAAPELRSAMVFDDVRGLTLDGFKASGTRQGRPTVVLKDVAGARLRDCTAPAAGPVFLGLQGASTAPELSGCHLEGASAPLRVEPGD